MKINVNQIPLEGLSITEDIPPRDLELESEGASWQGPLKVEAQISRITNAVTAKLSLSGRLKVSCSRCLSEMEIDLKKNLQLNYSVSQNEPFIDFNPDIRAEVILEYPLKPLCRPDCQGLCLKCGQDLNKGGCFCAIT